MRKNGYAIVDQEPESGLRSIAVPVYTHSNRVGAAINIGTHVSRMAPAVILGRFLPVLKEGARVPRNVLI